MKLGMYAVLDVKAKAHISPFCLPNDEMALRAFADCTNDADHMFCKHPQDYLLYRVGEFDVESGMVTPERRLLREAVMLKEVV